MAQNWKKLDPAMLRDDQTDTPYSTSTDKILPGIDPERVIREIKGMLVGDEYTYAEVTLNGILKTIEATGHVTSGQWQAIENIINAPRREGRHKHSRRY